MKYSIYQPDNATVQRALDEENLTAVVSDFLTEQRDAVFWHDESLSLSEVLERLDDIKLLIKSNFKK